MDPTQLSLDRRIEQNVPILDVNGEIDVYTVPRFKEHLTKLMDEGQFHILINLKKVGYMDSSGFGALLGATKRLRPNGGRLGLVSCNHVISRMLHITRLDTIFEMYESEEEALSAFAGEEAGA